MTKTKTELSIALNTNITQTQIEDFLLNNYVWSGTRFAHVDRPNQPLTNAGLLRTVRTQLTQRHPNEQVRASLVQDAIKAVTNLESEDLQRSLCVWSETFVCRPGDTRRILPNDTGTVDLNTWSKPAYRTLAVEPDSGVFRDFLQWLVSDDQQRRMLLNWLSWSLQNEDNRPRWGVMLYSQEKGTGKSTFAEVLRALFGQENSVVLNGVAKLTQKFNATALTKKFVNCEETDIAPSSRHVNDLKALFTDEKMAIERKGVEVEQVDLKGVFLFTSNHMPSFLPGLDRRLYVLDVGHEGHASGPRAEEFGQLVERVQAALADERQVAAYYRQLMRRPISPSFNPMSLNTAVQSTPIMKQILGCDDANQQLLSEFLEERGAKAITLDMLQHFGRSNLRQTAGKMQTMMLDLGWHRQKAKWGGAGHGRAIWVHPGYITDGGKLFGPDDFEDNLATHIRDVTNFVDP